MACRPVVVASLLCLGWPLFGIADSQLVSSPTVVVVASPEIEAHRLAIEGVQAAVGTPPQVRIVDLNQARNKQAAGVHLAAPGTRVIIAFGSEALQIVETDRPGVPVICTMVLNGTPKTSAFRESVAATVSLDISISDMLAQLKQLFPRETRIGIIRNPASGRIISAQLQARAQLLGFTVRIVNASGPEQLLPALLSLKGQVDFVWCLPDRALYNSMTIKPLILASIENRLPLIGFSESFARAGAALSIYPDFRDIGLQAGQAARQIMDNQPILVQEGPRRLNVAVNQTVLRLLGLRYIPPSSGGVGFMILK
jgi:putative ABC transport system substrate-binding protein